MRRFIAAALIAVCTPVFAVDQFYTIEDFSAGMKSHVSPYSMADGVATDAMNVRVNDVFGAIAKRDKRLIVATPHAAPVKSLYRYYLSDGTKHTITTSSTYMDAVDNSGNIVNLASGLSDGKRWSFVTYQDTLIGMNGTNNAKKWDGKTFNTANTTGHRTAGYLIADLGAPFCELLTGTHLDAASWYQYKVAYYNGSYYTYSSALSNPIQTGAAVYDIKVTDIPLGPSGTTQRILFRTQGQANVGALAGATYYPVAIINDNSTTTYSDIKTDTEIAANTSLLGFTAVRSGGAGYAAGDVVTVVQGANTTGSVTVGTVSEGTVLTLVSPATTPGTGYTAADGLATTSSHTGAVKTADVGSTAGTGYAVGDVLTITQGGASGGTVRVDKVGAKGALSEVTILTTGSGYSTSDNLATSGGSGSSGTISIVAGTASGLTVDIKPIPTWAVVAAGFDVTPPKAKYCVINGERLFIGCDPTTEQGKSIVYYSQAYTPQYFYYHTDYRLIRPDDGDEITFMKNLLGILTIGKTRTISKFYTPVSEDDWSISDPFSFVGCTAPYSAVNGIAGIMYFGRNGVYLFNGQSSTLVSDGVTDKTRDVLETNQDEIVGAYFQNSYYMAYTQASSGSAVNDRVLVLDVTRNAYVWDTYHVDSFAVSDSGDDAGILLSGSSDTDGTIFAHGDSFARLTYRYGSQLAIGTYVNAVNDGADESAPIISIGYATTWDTVNAGWTWNTIDANYTWNQWTIAGTWTSPIVQVNAAKLDKLAWDESLGLYGNVTFAVRTGADAAAVAAADWSSEYTDPSGSDISALTAAAYVQVRISLSSSVYTASPQLYVEDGYMWRMTYKKAGNVIEPAYLTSWTSNTSKFGGENPKLLKEVQVFYTGTEGTLTVSYDVEDGTTRSFDIDLSVNPATSRADAYYGTNEAKIFTHIPDFTVSPVGRNFRIKLSETGVEAWKVSKIVVRFEAQPYTTFPVEL